MLTPVHWQWRSGSECVGIVLVIDGQGMNRVVIGVAHGFSEHLDAQWIANHGAYLTFEEASPFFPGLLDKEKFR